MDDLAKSDQKKIRHPAKFSDPVLEKAKQILDVVQPEGQTWSILDPFCGTGKVGELAGPNNGTNRFTVGLEIEEPWAFSSRSNSWHIQYRGDATHMYEGWTDQFDCVFTSPCYGNRMADTFKPKDTSRRHTYIGYLREMTGDPDYKLAENSACGLQWGEAYRELHRKALAEMWRVLKPDGLLLLNMSDHVRNYERQMVCKWWVNAAHAAGFTLVQSHPIETARMREGENNDLRVPLEYLYEMRKVTK